MADAILFYRQNGQHGSIASLPDDQKLTFEFPDNVLEGIQDVYQNNIIDLPVPISDGTRRINKQENGLTRKEITINGIFKNPDIDDDVKKLEIIRGTLQVTDEFPFGVVGFDSPNAERFSLDPEDGNSPSEQGFTVKQTTIGFVGQKKTRYAFQVTLSFGGTVVLPSI